MPSSEGSVKIEMLAFTLGLEPFLHSVHRLWFQFWNCVPRHYLLYYSSPTLPHFSLFSSLPDRVSSDEWHLWCTVQLGNRHRSHICLILVFWALQRFCSRTCTCLRLVWLTSFFFSLYLQHGFCQSKQRWIKIETKIKALETSIDQFKAFPCGSDNQISIWPDVLCSMFKSICLNVTEILRELIRIQIKLWEILDVDFVWTIPSFGAPGSWGTSF